MSSHQESYVCDHPTIAGKPCAICENHHFQRQVLTQPNPKLAVRDPVFEEIMAMSEEELVAELAKEGETLESNAIKMRAIFERAKAEVDMRMAIRAWLKCPADKRPSPESLGKAIADRAASFALPSQARE